MDEKDERKDAGEGTHWTMYVARCTASVSVFTALCTGYAIEDGAEPYVTFIFIITTVFLVYATFAAFHMNTTVTARQAAASNQMWQELMSEMPDAVRWWDKFCAITLLPLVTMLSFSVVGMTTYPQFWNIFLVVGSMLLSSVGLTIVALSRRWHASAVYGGLLVVGLTCLSRSPL